MVSVNQVSSHKDTNTSSSVGVLKAKIPSLLLGIFALGLVFSTRTVLPPSQQEVRQLIAPPPMIEHMTFGFQEVTADMLWIRSLQDFDYCENQVAENTCQGNSWLFRMLDAVTNLSPNFRIPYAAGGLALTVIISDYEGATKIFDKGVKAFPNDWPILYRAAYHYMYEVKDNKRAAELLIQAGDNGAPKWVYTLAGRLYSDSGNIELAQSLLQDMIKTGQDKSLIDRLQAKIQEIKSQSK